jgi:hypothetical protein
MLAARVLPAATMADADVDFDISKTAGSYSQRPPRRAARRARRVTSFYSGIQTPKKLKPHWLKCGFQKGFS